MNLVLIYDDTIPVPDSIRALTAIDHFGELIFRKKPLSRYIMDAAVGAGIRTLVHLQRPQDLKELARSVHEDEFRDAFYLYMPSHLMATDAVELRLHLQKLAFAKQRLLLAIPGHALFAATALFDAKLFRLFLAGDLLNGNPDFFTERRKEFLALNNAPGFVNLSDYAEFLNFLSSNFEVRFFNAITADGPTLRKHSTDKAKIRREYNFHRLLPEELQMYFVRPFGLEERSDDASYRMERLHVPDVAIQWVHGALSPTEFACFIDRVFGFIASRPTRPLANRVGVQSLYLTKLEERLKDFRSKPLFNRVDAMIAHATRYRGGLDEIVERYRRALGRLGRAAGPPVAAISHGDLCLSNILYDKRTQLLRFIDPRGADDVDQLYLEASYDVAKLSHSVLGGYDYINAGLFEIEFDASASLRLRLEHRDQTAHQELFRAKLREHGFNEEIIRFYEGSLFLSMLPLHSDVPKKVLAFILTAAAILEELG